MRHTRGVYLEFDFKGEDFDRVPDKGGMVCWYHQRMLVSSSLGMYALYILRVPHGLIDIDIFVHDANPSVLLNDGSGTFTR